MPPMLAPSRAVDIARPWCRSNQGDSVVLIAVLDRQAQPTPSTANVANSCQGAEAKPMPATPTAIAPAPNGSTRPGPSRSIALPTSIWAQADTRKCVVIADEIRLTDSPVDVCSARR